MSCTCTKQKINNGKKGIIGYTTVIECNECKLAREASIAIIQEDQQKFLIVQERNKLIDNDYKDKAIENLSIPNKWSSAQKVNKLKDLQDVDPIIETGFEDQVVGYDGTSGINKYKPRYVLCRTILSAYIGGTVASLTTNYASLIQGAFGTAMLSTSTTARQGMLPFSGKAINLIVRTTNGQSSNNDLKVRIRKNGVDTPLEVLIPKSGGANRYYDFANSISFTQGDLIDCKIINQANATSASIAQISLEYVSIANVSDSL